MNRMSRISLFVLLVCLSHEVCAQPYCLVPETGKLLSTGNAFDKAEMRNFWNSGRNAAGRQDTVTVSYAGLGGEYETGGFRDYWEAKSSWRAGATARTITHLDRISMSGTFSFENFSGEGMCGSMSARPDIILWMCWNSPQEARQDRLILFQEGFPRMQALTGE